MKVSRKVWLGVGVVAGASANAQTTSAAPAATAPAAVMYHGSTHKPDYAFAKALQKHLAGEGGEGGIGFSASGPEFKIPALDEAQLRMALPGNTIRKDQAVAIYFDPNGTVQGWKRDWAKADMSACPTALGEDYEIENGVCYTATVNPLVGKYAFKGNQVCMPAYSGKSADGQACYYIAFATKYVMIGDGQRTYGSGKDLVKGRVLDTFRKRGPKAD
ncbi:MAG: hypothetical protein IPP44_20740 [Ideonella sp.]|nr:hypothetical protein [Ideonella sp.]